MKHSKIVGSFCCILILSSFNAIAQEQDEFRPYHRVAFVLSHAHVPSAVGRDGKEWLTLPAFGLDYDYSFSRRWTAGIHSDLIVENFLVESNLGNDERVLERSRPVAIAAVAGFKPVEHLTCVLGFGAELAKEENLFLARLGAEYGWEVSQNWEIAVSLMYDLKWDAYDTWVFGFGASRSFGKAGKRSR